MAFDKERAIRILGEQTQTYEELLRDHVTEADHKTADELIEMHSELTADRDTVVGLKEYLEVEYDCS